MSGGGAGGFPRPPLMNNLGQTAVWGPHVAH